MMLPTSLDVPELKYLRGGYGEFLILYNSQAYSTKLAHYYWFIITKNFWNFYGNLWIISREIKKKVLRKKA